MTHARSSLLLLAVALTSLTACGSTPDPTPLPEPEVVSIAEARALAADMEATVEGFVTVAPGTFASSLGDAGFAIQDASAGIYVSLKEELPFGLNVKVRARGRLAQVAQQTTLVTDAASVEVLTESEETTSMSVDSGAVNESVEGLLVYVTGAVTKPVEDDQPYGYKVYIDGGTGEIQVFVNILNGAPLVDVSKLAVGMNIQVTGLASQYESTYEVAPRSEADLVISAAPN